MIVAAVIIAVLIAALVATTAFWINWWWFDSIGYRSVLVTRYAARTVAFITGGLLAGAFFAANWVFALRRSSGQPARPGALPGGSPFVRLPLWLLTAGVVLVAGTGAASRWERWLLFLRGGDFGIADPIFGRDAGFYVFALPALTTLQRGAIALLLATLVVVIVLYALLLGLDRADDLRRPPRRVRTHVLVLVGGLLLLLAAGYLLANYRLLYSTRGAVYGVGFTDANVTRWANYLLALLSVAVAALLLLNAFVRRLRPLLIAAAAWGGAALLLGVVVPAAVQETVVEPSELRRERPYIENNIGLTRAAFALDGIETRQLSGRGEPSPDVLAPESPIFDNIRLWDYRVVRRIYQQVRSFVPYFRFFDVDVDRYQLDGELRQVVIAARELDVDGLAESAQTWVNRHLAYTHGYGVVVSPVSEAALGDPLYLVGDIPPEATGALAIDRPEIYFGEYGDRPPPWVAVHTEETEISGIFNETEAVPYAGAARGSIPLDSYPRRLLLALFLGDRRVLFSPEWTEESRVLLRRDIVDRVRSVAPFLDYDDDPYLVIAGGRLVWIIDAYTTTDRFPYSTPVAGLNYVRSAAKVTIDAYDGTITFYRTTTPDPIADAYGQIFDDLFTPIAEAPEEVAAHFRYPEDLFDLQTEVFASYHVTDPSAFYNGEDRWAIAQEQVEGELRRMEAYYVTLPLPGETADRFGLVLPFTPINRPNMTAWMTAQREEEGEARLLVYRFPRQVNVSGPQQVEARINQDPQISAQLTLLDQQGSRVIRGNMLVIPTGETVLYVQPLYLEAAGSGPAIPELQYVIVATNERIAMRPTLADALAALAGTQDAPAVPPDAPAADGQAPPPVVDAATADLAQQALDAYERAQQALARGDWAAYGEEQANLESILRRLTGEPDADVPAETPAGTPTAAN